MTLLLPLSQPQEPRDKVLDLAEAQQYHRTSYLIPYAWEWEVVERWFDKNFDIFFQNELRGIEPDRALWPDPGFGNAFVKLGCGIANCPGVGNYVACNYAPGGNISGQRPY